ncbi:chemotaxis protein methyltransferase CheR [Peptoclostridium litorale DSM 5388]|uniref:protein-glutamate O-methyltransferase n=1 Tax=Peptoclostridium litorale DSM 5388 TaxID=1121324 RepID=A0A069REE4_PEPLI|nr:protein-glutamate O-methyltransferase CheR [Peptoclostridium litorale]KDR94555.1 chemotaxis protein methyltransferase CheR [Peptoclostridium litorale DSM 5388]SIO31338.1 chemotaxis protein methyltransferase CheR [Peptoclostridium litorale DSM 5388]
MIKITEREFELLSDYIKSNYGIYIKKKKQTLLMGRLSGVLNEMGFTSFMQYYNYMLADKSGAGVVTLVDKITTNHTYFMRESDHFQYFKGTVLPYLEHSVKDRDLRIWSAACSSGEEAYTLAMIMDEYFSEKKTLWDTKLLATDISQSVLKTAKKGVYTRERMHPIPESWKVKYFKRRDDENFVIKDEIKNKVIYRKFNLIEKRFPFRRKFHTIFCRNVMIYFDHDTKYELVEKFYDCIEPGGYLFVGHSESLEREKTRFKYVRPAVYRKE